jgi:CRISPR type III-B/RAMP module-associated protein Cmr3
MSGNDILVLRDGHPFGEIGTIESYIINWPLPQTITGMLRSKIGFTIDPDFFKNEQNQKKIFSFGIKRQIPVLADGTYMVSIPADIVFTKSDGIDRIKANIPTFKKVNAKCGTDIINNEWLIPILDIKQKPADQVPFFLKWNIFEKYLANNLNGFEDDVFSYGCTAPIIDERMHNAIDSTTLTPRKSQLFANKGIHLAVHVSEEEISEIKIFLSIEGDLTGLDITGDAYLGGERKTVNLQSTNISFPACPDIFHGQKYLKLILATHGDFGGWCPDWLSPDLDSNTLEWKVIPGTNHKIRLVSAFINGNTIISGWDYFLTKPKASKKLVKPGAVYIIELESAGHSQMVAEMFWGNAFDVENNETALNSFGQLFVGKTGIKQGNEIGQ